MTLIARTAITCALLVGCLQATGHTQGAEESKTAVLVQGSDIKLVIAAVCAVGGDITHELGIINAVGALLTGTQIDQLKKDDDTLRIQADRKASVDTTRQSGTTAKSAGASETASPCPPSDEEDAVK